VADGEELASGSRRPGGRSDGAATGTTTAAATGELAVVGAPAARFTGLPWLGITVSTTAAAAAARTKSAITPAVTPVRKLTSSSRALTAARMPGHEPTVR
jgi:hypothetical protein